MRKYMRLIVTFLMVFAISFGTVATVSYTATAKTVDQKKAAKNIKKFYKKVFKEGNYWYYSVTSKKTGKRYIFTITGTSKTDTAEQVRNDVNLYNQLISTTVNLNKIHYKNAKKAGLKKPTVKIIIKSIDGQILVSTTNGQLD